MARNGRVLAYDTRYRGAPLPHNKALARCAQPYLLPCVTNSYVVCLQPRRASTFRDKAVIAIPMMFDLVATALMSIGLLFVTASVYQILRGSEMLFCALYSVAILRRPLNKFHYLGLAGAVVSNL